MLTALGHLSGTLPVSATAGTMKSTQPPEFFTSRIWDRVFSHMAGNTQVINRKGSAYFEERGPIRRLLRIRMPLYVDKMPWIVLVIPAPVRSLTEQDAGNSLRSMDIMS